jgi:uncharacterized protein YkwD
LHRQRFVTSATDQDLGCAAPRAIRGLRYGAAVLRTVSILSVRTRGSLAVTVATLLTTSITQAAPDDARSTERSLRSCANHERAKAGLPRLHASRALAQAARAQAKAMAQRGFFAHRDPSGHDARQRVAMHTNRYGPRVGENLAAGQPTVRRTCEAWMRSPDHRANILDPRYDHIGAGFARGGSYGRYLVQVFGDAR